MKRLPPLGITDLSVRRHKRRRRKPVRTSAVQRRRRQRHRRRRPITPVVLRRVIRDECYTTLFLRH